MKTIHLANVACGFHASYAIFKLHEALVLTMHGLRDFSIMNETVRLAKANNVLVGAHPSLPDRQGWGRREMAMEPVRLIPYTDR